MVANSLYNTKPEIRRLTDRELDILAELLYSVDQQGLSDERAIEAAHEAARLVIEVRSAHVL